MAHHPVNEVNDSDKMYFKEKVRELLLSNTIPLLISKNDTITSKIGEFLNGRNLHISVKMENIMI